MNLKKAEISQEIAFTFVRIIFLVVILFSVVLLVKVFFLEKIDTRETEASIFFNRVLYGKEGILHYDEKIERLYPGIIDLKKFQDAGGDQNYLGLRFASYGDTPLLAAQLTLKQEGNLDMVAYYNKEQFNRWEPRALSSVKAGAGSVSTFTKRAYVLVWNGEKLSPATLQAIILV